MKTDTNRPRRPAARPHRPKRSPEKYIPWTPPPVPEHTSHRPSWLKVEPHVGSFVFFDLETTGGNPQNSDVIEFAAIRYENGHEVARMSSLLNPMRKIPRMVQQITGITDPDVEGAPTIHDLIDDIIKFVGNSILVSHGVLNDISFLKNYAKTLRRIELENYYLCTHNLVTHLMPQLPAKSLSAVAEHFLCNVEDAHRALADAELTSHIFWKLVEIGKYSGYTSIEELLKIQSDPFTLSRLGSGLSHHEISKAPPGPGLFYLFNNQREVAYVAATPNLRASIQKLGSLSEEKDFNKLLVDVSSLSIERTSHFLEALFVEKSELTKLHLPIDPRKFEDRAQGIVQILIPEDIQSYVEKNYNSCPSYVRKIFPTPKPKVEQASPDSKWAASLDYPRKFGDESILTEPALRDESIAIRNSKKLAGAIKSKKFNFTRKKEEFHSPFYHSGSLKEGLGWFLGPVDSPKLLISKLERILELFPFHKSDLDTLQRLYFLNLFQACLFGGLDTEISELQLNMRSKKSILDFKINRNLQNWIDHLESAKKIDLSTLKEAFPKHGVILVTNKDEKQMCVAAVVCNQIIKTILLPFEDMYKLKSPRFFSRLFAGYPTELEVDNRLISFTEQQCANIELFVHWYSRGRNEGEWVSFDQVKPLFDPNILN